ncbi:MAG TPA: CoA transferase [Burkholderiaceae bacterium]|nr:CoA transferase [Burkholderiaceae bacterium]
MPPAEAPLAPYTVLDFTIARAGPTAVRLLADWGANVIRVEGLRHDRGLTGRRHGSDEQNLHRNKRSLSLDLKSPRGREVLDRLVQRADVVVENFRADVKQRLGLAYERLHAINPRIVLASISGFGQDGPYADRPGVDQIVQGCSGLMSITGEPGRGPMRVGIAVSDTSAGMFLGQGILLALLQRERTGVGQWVHTSLLEAMLNKLDFQAARYTVSGEVPQQEGNHHPTLAPMGAFRARDGVVNIAASSQKMWQALCAALDAPQLATRPEFATEALRNTNRLALQDAIEALTQRWPAAELVQRLNPAGVPCGPILDIGQAFADPQARHLRMTRAADHRTLGTIDLLRSPINLSACPHPQRFARAAPDPGEHSAELLREAGFDDAAIASLIDEGVVA